MKSTDGKYGSVAIVIHWLSALVIFAMLGSGFRAASTADGMAKASVLSVHVTLGLTILVLTLARIAWWVFADRKPSQPADGPGWQAAGAKAVHILFYVVILGMAASGIGMMVLSGAAAILFGGAEGALPNFWNYAPRIPHGLGARAMVALAVLHIGAALYHHFVLKDGLIHRMWFGKVD